MHKILMGLALAATLLLTGCGDPCEGIVLTERDQTAIDNGGEVDKVGKFGTECEFTSDGVETDD